jgi:hypothetical protein
MNEQKRERAAGTSAPACSPYLAGVQAYLDGVVVGDNPYHEDTDEHWRWMKGWVAAGMESRNMKSFPANTRIPGTKCPGDADVGQPITRRA